MANFNIKNLHQWSAYIQGAQEVLLRWKDEFEPYLKPTERIYFQAEIALALKDMRSTERYLLRDRISYRNHVKNKQGKVISCEAYFEDPPKPTSNVEYPPSKSPNP